MTAMKKCVLLTLFGIAVAAILLASLLANHGAGQRNKMNAPSFYSADTFSSVVVGVSTIHDVYEIAPMQELLATSYGALCKYPISSTECLCIKFYGSEMVVGAIEICPNDINAR